MSKENSYQAVILKKTPYGEGDEILTFFTKEAGKIRALAKSSKFAKSKLQYGLQTLFLVNVTLAGSGLPKVIGIEVINPFAKLRASFAAAKISFYALELVLKFTPDEQKNENLFSLLAAFLGFLDSAASLSSRPQFLSETASAAEAVPHHYHEIASSAGIMPNADSQFQVNNNKRFSTSQQTELRNKSGARNDTAEDSAMSLGLAKFKIEFLESLGLGIHHPASVSFRASASESRNPLTVIDKGSLHSSSDAFGFGRDDKDKQIGFSNSRGGFLLNPDAVDYCPVSPAAFSQFLELKQVTFEELVGGKPLKHNLTGDLTELHALLSEFLTYQLEREIKSEKYLKL